MIPDVVVIGTKFWDNLSEIEKEWVQAAANESVTAEKRFWKETVEENMKVLKEANVNFIYPDKTQFSNKTDVLTQKMMTNPKLKLFIERIKAVE
jgi:TRAP-type C4-dicarboxylate transport system substrate-binding protein